VCLIPETAFCLLGTVAKESLEDATATSAGRDINVSTEMRGLRLLALDGVDIIFLLFIRNISPATSSSTENDLAKVKVVKQCFQLSPGRHGFGGGGYILISGRI
jgi:hypothetical protein